MTDQNDHLPDEWKDVATFMRQVDESYDLFNRSIAAYPIDRLPGVRKHHAELERRWKNGDRHVIAYMGDDDKPSHFEQEITTEEKNRLIRLFLEEINTKGAHRISERDLTDKATLFVRQIAHHGFAMPISEASIPPCQKERKRNLDSVANAFDKLVDSLNSLDSAALGWLFAAMEDSAAKSGLSLRQSITDSPNMKDKPILAMVEGGEMRQAIQRISEAIGTAVREAGKSLPKVDRDNNDPRLHATFFLERQLQENGIKFEVTETCFAAECLRTMFDLGGYDTERVSYWLKKVAETPSHKIPWFGAIRKSAD